jgi:hypothetical protein
MYLLKPNKWHQMLSEMAPILQDVTYKLTATRSHKTLRVKRKIPTNYSSRNQITISAQLCCICNNETNMLNRANYILPTEATEN